MGSRFAKTTHAHLGRDPGFAPDPHDAGVRPAKYGGGGEVLPEEYQRGGFFAASASNGTAAAASVMSVETIPDRNTASTAAAFGRL